MRILVTGASGFVGSRLVAALDGEGHEVRAMTRRPDHPDFERKDADAARVFARAAAATGIDRIVYLGGLGQDSGQLSRQRAAAARSSGSWVASVCRRRCCARTSW